VFLDNESEIIAEMERSVFQRELAKYKIVRNEDYIKPREKRPEVKRIEARPVVSEGPKVKLTRGTESESSSFWDLMTSAARELLSEEETTRFLSALRQNYTDVPELINMEDLNYAASLI
jgi:hypothetical protein